MSELKINDSFQGIKLIFQQTVEKLRNYQVLLNRSESLFQHNQSYSVKIIFCHFSGSNFETECWKIWTPFSAAVDAISRNWKVQNVWNVSRNMRLKAQRDFLAARQLGKSLILRQKNKDLKINLFISTQHIDRRTVLFNCIIVTLN